MTYTCKTCGAKFKHPYYSGWINTIISSCGAKFEHLDVIYMPDMANPYPTDIVIEVCPKCGSTDITRVTETS